MARQQRHLAGDDTELRTPRTATRLRCRLFNGRGWDFLQPPHHVARRATKIHIDGVGGGVIEDQDRCGLVLIENRLRPQRHFAQRARGDPMRAMEGRAGSLLLHVRRPLIPIERHFTRIK